MVVVKKLLGKENVITDLPSLDESGLSFVNKVWKDSLDVVCNNFANAFVYGIATGDGPEILNT